VKLKSTLFFNISGLLFAFASLMVSIANNDPTSANLGMFGWFYVSFFLTIWLFLSLLLFFIKTRVLLSQTPFGLYLPSLRQSFFISLALTLLLLLKGLKILDWWIGASVTVSFLLLELFFETKRIKTKVKY
jgi:hypothetical protein